VSKTSAKAATKRPPARDIKGLRGRPTGRRRGWTIAAAVVVVFALVVLYQVYQSSQGKHDTIAGGSGFTHVAGEPGAGTAAPAFTLTSGTGGQVSLTDFRGRNVLLYFQEGLSCQPCWDQIKDLEQNQAALKTAGVDAVVSITTDPANLIGQKATDEKLTTPVLSDPSMQVSRAYDANSYGMMGDMRDGHSFILVGPDGTIRWRADYGGKPDYTMFLPTAKMLTDLTAEQKS
jgi:peroxiredoxin Q/BCP